MKSLLLTVGLFLGLCFVYILLMLSKTDCFFTYIIDDAYIHLALAKNFALHKTWGMTKYAFSSSSSSPIFTFILSILIYIFGNNGLIPLLFNIVTAFFAVYFLNKYYSAYFKNSKHIITANIFTLFFAVIHLQIVMGMEHVLQVFVVIVNIYYFQKWIASDFKNSDSSYWFYIMILMLGLIRFESMFYFISLAVAFLILRKFKNALLTLFLGFIPILIFGYFNYQQAGYFFPNSVVVKGTQPDLSGDYLPQIKFFLFNKILLNPSFYKIGLFPLLIGITLIYRDYKNKMDFKEIVSNNFLIIVWSLTLILHSLFGNFRGGYRYEAYILVAFSMIIIPRIKAFFFQPKEMLKKEKVMVLFISFNLLLLLYKLGYAHLMIVNGSANIYEQQIQSAKFLKKYYNTSKVVANDIGAICYFSDIHLLDIAGLGSKEMIQFNEKGKIFGEDFKNFLTKYCTENDYQLAIVYEEWFMGCVPENWKKVAVLKVNNSINVAIDHVVIYSINPKIYRELKENVRNFNWNKNVQVNLIE